jgi:Peptidase family M28
MAATRGRRRRRAVGVALTALTLLCVSARSARLAAGPQEVDAPTSRASASSASGAETTATPATDEVTAQRRCADAAAPARASRSPALDVAAAQANLTALLCWARRGEAAQDVAAFLVARLRALGADVRVEPVGRVELPALTFLKLHLPARSVDATDPNVLVRFGPPGPALLLLAHYDAVPGSPGAADNGAAVALLLELARALSAKAPAQPVMIALTALEEAGLVGARALVARHAAEVRFAVALDLIGTSGALTVNGASTLIRRAELRWLQAAAARAEVTLDVPLLHRTISRLVPQLERSDHGPFTERGIAALHLYHRGAGGELIDLAYHTAHDTGAGRVSPARLDELGRLLLALSQTAPPAQDHGDGFWVPVASGWIAPRGALIAASGALLALALGCGVAFVPRRRAAMARGVGLLGGLALLAVVAGALFAVERLTAAGHPAPWAHRPLRAVSGLLLLGFGSLTFALGLLQRVLELRGERRFLIAAVALLLLLGGTAGALDAWELAWLWLVPAALLAIAPRCGSAGWVPLSLAAAASCLLVGPHHLREAMFNGFFSSSIPLALWLTVTFLPHALAYLWWRACRPRPGPGREALALLLGLLAVAAGTALYVTILPVCTPDSFAARGLSCELPSPGGGSPPR